MYANSVSFMLHENNYCNSFLVGWSAHSIYPYLQIVQYIFLSLLGADMDVSLSNYGHCNFVSAKHACIFYDEVSSNFWWHVK